MQYYQALVYVHRRNEHDIVYGELYTVKEFNKLNVKDEFFRIVEINQRQTYWFFGCRFPFHEHKYRLNEECERFTCWK